MIELKRFRFRFRFHFIFLTIWFQFHLLLSLTAARDQAPSPSSAAAAAASNRGEIDLPFPAKAVALFCALIFISIFSFYLNHWAASTIARGELTAAGADFGGGDCRRNPGGIRKEILDTFPILVYSTIKDLRIGVESLECAVCLSEFKDYETLRLIPKCDHVFHPECIDTWLASHVTCPLCRTNLNPDSGEVAVGVPNPSDANELGEENNQENSGSRRGDEAMMSETQDESVSAVANNNNESGISNNNSGESDIDGGSNDNVMMREYCSSSSSRAKESRNRRSRWRFFGKLPRSNSTGHSLVEVKPTTGSVKNNNNMERHTLRLPEDVRRYIFLNHAAIGRSASCHVATAPTTPVKGMGIWSDSEGSSRGKRNYVERTQDRWVLSATPPFVRRKD